MSWNVILHTFCVIKRTEPKIRAWLRCLTVLSFPSVLRCIHSLYEVLSSFSCLQVEGWTQQQLGAWPSYNSSFLQVSRGAMSSCNTSCTKVPRRSELPRKQPRLRCPVTARPDETGGWELQKKNDYSANEKKYEYVFLLD